MGAFTVVEGKRQPFTGDLGMGTPETVQYGDVGAFLIVAFIAAIAILVAGIILAAAGHISYRNRKKRWFSEDSTTNLLALWGILILVGLIIVGMYSSFS